MYYGNKLRVNHLKVFGCLAVMKTQEKKRSGYQPKLENRGTCGIMVGYDRDYTYRIYDIDSNKIVILRDVLFDESKSLNKEAQYDEIDKIIQEMYCDDYEEEFIENENTLNESNNMEEMLNHYYENCYLLTEGQDITFNQIKNSSEYPQWKEAMDIEYKNLIKKKTWKLIDIPNNCRPVDCKWVYGVDSTLRN